MSANVHDKSEKMGWSCLSKLLLFGFGVPLLLVICVVVWWTSRQAIAKSNLNAKLSEDAAEGLPVDNESMQIYYSQATTSDELDAWMFVLAEANSEQTLRRTSRLPGPFSVEEKRIPTPGEIAGDAMWDGEAEVRDFLSDRQPWYDEADRVAASMHSVRLPISFDGIETLLETTQQMRSVARMHQLRFSVSLIDGDSRQATASVVSTLAAAKAIEHQPILVSGLICSAIRGVAIGMIRNGLLADIFQPDQLGQIDAAFDRFADPSDRYRNMLIGERALALATLRSQRGSGLAGSIIPMTGPTSQLALYDFMGDAIDGVQNDLFDSLPGMIELQKRLDAENVSAGIIARLDNMGRDLLMPALQAASVAFASDIMQEHLARTAMAVRRYHADKGQWPTGLNQLEASGLPVDRLRPIGDEPFGYRIDTGESDAALLWGFEPREQMESLDKATVPEEPPPAPEDMYSGEVGENVWVYEVTARDY